ncbi:MAG: ATP-binding cassette domain-containing protein [Sporomusaceae bacterium]|nr:ATP-binding cassette domain-containing protein [Sporomusaceae bacterium]
MLEVSVEKKLADFTLQVNFSVDQETLVLFGPSGCGKTTTLRCIAGLTKPDKGKIISARKVFFDSAARVSVQPRKRNIGYMFQDYALFPHMSVKQNIWYGVKESGIKAQELYENLLDLLRIHSLERRAIHQLSGGEKQRVALARSLMAQPEILLLDEPLSALDQKSRAEVQEELKRMQQLWNIPFILVTHDAAEAEALGDRILFMEQGRQVAFSAMGAAVKQG